MTTILSGTFYPVYKAKNNHFSPDTFKCAEDTVSKLLSQQTTSESPLMLLGKVQSGKTRTFISTIALAFDNRFDISIVLSKNSKALLQQTLERLRSELKEFIDNHELEVYDILHTPNEFTKYELDETKLLFVAKKQDNNLKRLIELFRNNPDMRKRRVLFIDDEADNASIGYAKSEGLVEARKIAKQISDLRSLIEVSSYLQVTATPYSLYLQPTEFDLSNVTDFKPIRPAETQLVPVGDGYVGGEIYFGESAQHDDETLETLIHHTVNHEEFERLKKADARSLKLSEILTSNKIVGYRTALVNFFVGSCIQRLNGQENGTPLKKLKFSFLLHSEASRIAHQWQEQLTREFISSLNIEAQKQSELFMSLITDSYKDLSRSLRLAKQPIPPLSEVVKAVSEALINSYITVVKVNSDDDVAALLDGTGQLRLRSPINIFLGGQALDRGVTLSGLIGFYYGRRPNKFQQDTVLQHSRMYGYRRADIAVTRFYTSKAIRHAMRQMEEFDTSLRAAIESGAQTGVQFIRKAEDGSIIPCSPNKILVSTTQSLRPGKRILPIGFQTGYHTGTTSIAPTVAVLDQRIQELCGFQSQAPTTISIDKAIDLLNLIEPTLHFIDDDTPKFDWDVARSALSYLSQQHKIASQRGKVLIWAARDRNSGRLAKLGTHATYIETPDSHKTEGQLASKFAIDSPILFLLRQNGAVEKGWRGTPFYWPVIRAQVNTPTTIYASETID